MDEELLGGRYRVGAMLGRGGMGEVYRAVDVARDRLVALKTLSGSADERYAGRLRREAELVSRLADPHIVDVFDTGDSDDGGLYVAMRLVEGPDLRRVLAEGPLDPQRAVGILSQVAQALDAAHTGGVVHRDVKPSNILIGPDGDAHLTDFGIARPLEPGVTRLTRTGAYVGSLDYIAPEQLRGRDVTGTADVYSLACVLYECLTGKVPFPAADPAAKLAAQLNDPPAAPSVFDPRIPPALDMVVATGMDKDPQRRFASAGELMAAAASALGDGAPRDRAEPTVAGDHAEPGKDILVRAIVSVAARRQQWADRAHAEAVPPAGSGAEAVCPYPGLRSFGTGDAAWFHGRDAEITELLVRLSRQSAGSGPLVVVGASGTGKSSLLRAGLFPVLDEAGCDWPRVVLTPGERPVETLAARVAAVTGADPVALAARIREHPETWGEYCHSAGRGGGDTRLMIVVDQFEQLFTDGAVASDRTACVTALAHAWPAIVVLAVRADYVPDFITLEPLKAALDSPFVVGPLDAAALRQVITLPARAAGLKVEDGLVDRLIGDVGARDGCGSGQGALPRLAHALRETWLARQGQSLTLSGYQATGGIDRAVAVTADQLYGRLGSDERAELRTALLRMVKVLPDGGLARRRADRGELAGRALADLVDARLVSVDDEGARLCHDALLTAWPRLRTWVEDDRQDLLLQQRLDESATSWREGGRDRGDLYRGARLAAALEWSDRGRELTTPVGEFLQASRREHQRTTRRLRGAAGTLAALLVLALIAGGLALNARDHAERQARVALSRQLAAQSLSLAEWDPAGAREAALKAWHAAQTTEARGALLSADSLSQPVGFDSRLAPVTAVDVSDDGGLVAVGGVGASGSTVVVRDTRTGGRVKLDNADLGEETVQAVQFSPDGSLLAVAAFDGAGVRVWDTADGRLLTTLKGGGDADDGAATRDELTLGPLAWRPDGKAVAAQSVTAEGSRISTWDPRTGESRSRLTTAVPAERIAYSVVYDPGGSRLAVGRVDGSVELWDPASGTRVHRSTAHRDSGERGPSSDTAVVVAFSSELLASASQADRSIRLAARATGEAVGVIEDRTRSEADAAPGPGLLTFSGDGNQLLTATGSDVVVWDPVDRRRLGEYPRGKGQGTSAGQAVLALATSGDASTTVAARAEGGVTIWRRDTPWYEAPRGSVLGVAFAPDGEHAAAVDGKGTLHTWNWATGHHAAEPSQLTAAGREVAYAPDGTRVTGAQDGTLTVTSPEGESRKLTLDGRGFLGNLAISGDGSLLAAAGSDPSGGTGTDTSGRTDGDSVHVWDLASLKPLAELRTGAGTVSALSFSPDGARLLAVSSEPALGTSGEADDTGSRGAGDAKKAGPVALNTWRTADLGAPPSVTKTGDDVIDAVHTPDGKSLLVASVTGRVQVRDAATGELRREFGHHPSAIRALALSPDGTTLATATTDDSAVRLWDLREGTLKARLGSGSGFEVNDLAFSPDGTVLARAGSDAAVALWRMDTGDAVARICRSLGEAGAGSDADEGLCPSSSRAG
ncbi:hypothetical protein B590_17204 [Streptomyces sp. PVA_94-07]|uniref:WD40 repeat domain-containing serine/threonine protein kinase n=1 Tax=Streptomyces sp. PVA_94-07 TaxID=1225337 RepID=UPI0003C2B784|nr:WD40 repeat domain-containing serine/threonine-protein kinase [Streptomyces sp. PVA_94-07]ESQ03997.1 hypothetical protein B590_17204 [Streptomyces sp. PVA_94-07]